MSERDDLDWFELVAGRHAPGAAPAVVREAAIVRASLLAKIEATSEVPVDDPRLVDAQAQRLRARARLEGLLPAAEPDGIRDGQRPVLQSTPLRLFGWRPALALAVVVGLSVGIATFMPTHTTKEELSGTMRGALPGLFSREVSDPAAAAAMLGDALRRSAVEAKIYAAGDYWYVEATLPDHPPPDIVDAWRAAGLPEIAKGRVRVLFSKPGR